MNTKTTKDFLEEWRTSIIFDVIALSVYFILGVVGNTIVLAVYKYQMEKISSERYFIPVLATTDLIASALCTSLCIFWDMTPGFLESSIVCSIIFYMLGVLTLLSVSFLFCIALQRYFKMCNKLSLSLNTRRAMSIISLIFSFGFASPYLYRKGIVELTKDNLTVTVCTTRQMSLSFAYPVAIVTVASCVMLSFIFMYGKIGFKLFVHLKTYNLQQKEKKRLITYKTEEETGISNTTTQNEDVCKSEGVTVLDKIEMTRNSDKTQQQSLRKTNNSHSCHVTFPCDIDKKGRKTNTFPMSMRHRIFKSSKYATNPHPIVKAKNKSKPLKNKFVVMFMVITGVFGLCYIPVSVLVIFEGIYPDLWMRIPQEYISIVLFSWHMYILNHIVNPFIYAFMDKQFLRAVKSLFQRFFSNRTDKQNIIV